jgi:hypothetical protein
VTPGCGRVGCGVIWRESESNALLIGRREVPARVFTIDLTSGQRKLFKTFTPADRQGCLLISRRSFPVTSRVTFIPTNALLRISSAPSPDQDQSTIKEHTNAHSMPRSGVADVAFIGHTLRCCFATNSGLRRMMLQLAASANASSWLTTYTLEIIAMAQSSRFSPLFGF